MSEYENRYKRPYINNTKLVKDGTVQRVKELLAEKKTYSQIGDIIGKSRQQVSQICSKIKARGY